jgi:hypothetical protein
MARIGYSVNPDGVQGLEYSDIRQNNYDNPGQFGANVSANLYSGRPITLEGWVYGDTITQYEQRRRTFLQNFAIERDAFSLPVAKSLKFTTGDDLQLQADVHVAKVRFQRKNLFGAKYSIDLYAPDYLLYDQNLQSSVVSRASGGGAVYPIIYPIIYGASVGGSALLVNAGTAETYPIIYLNGPLTNPIIQNDTLGRYIELNLTIADGEQVIIDMKKKTILKGTLSVIANKSTPSKFWWLARGSNSIKFFTSSTGDTGSAQIQWQNAYVGV